MNRDPLTAAELAARDQKLDVLKVLVSHMGHEFKNLLVPQLGYATLIREEVGPESTVAPFAIKLQDASRKADQYLEAILTAVRPQRRFRPQPLDLAETVEQAISHWKSRLPSGVGIHVSTELSSCRGMLDEVHWQNALLQLLNNCQEAMPSAGNIRVTLAPERALSNPAETLGLSGTEIFRLQIQDSGSGMMKEVRDRCFEPFFSTRAKVQNRGIGLTLAHSVVLLHGGQIVVDSEPEKGTTVTIWLPEQ